MEETKEEPTKEKKRKKKERTEKSVVINDDVTFDKPFVPFSK